MTVKKMNTNDIRKVATSKQTGGGGFVFEDKVSAWFVAHFLSDRIPFTSEIGKINKIDYQVRPDGWLFDDMLLTLEHNNVVRKVAICSKSNSQINTTGPNDELLRDIWNQYLGVNSDVFNKDSDYLCIVNSQLPQAISKNVNTLITFSRSQEAETLHQRINQNDTAFSQSLKKLYKGFYCPVDIATTYDIDEGETIKVISKLLLIEFDFENAVSNNENQIIDICRDCLSNPDGTIEQQLYKTLSSIRSELAPVSGFLDYKKLIEKLRNYFQLKGYANHHNDWNKIITASKSKIDSIPDKIGNKVSLSNSLELETIESLIKDNQTIFILGKSGYGKSVLAKKYIQEKLTKSDKYVWVDSQSIQNGNLESFFGLQNSLSDIFNKVQLPNCYLFIDGIDRFFKDSDLSSLYEILSIASNSKSFWKIIISCQTDDYNEVLEKLYRININLNSVDFKVNHDVFSSVSELRLHFPELAELFKHTHLLPILKNLKYLDLLAYNLTKKSSISESDFLGESTIIDWIWKTEIESKGATSSRFLQDFSEKQAQKLSVSIPVSDFSISELAPLDGLKENKVLIEIEDKLYLTHDLFGDWARYKLIRANNDNVKLFLQTKELFSPLWCKAIRLYGIYLLDKNNDASEWIKLFKTLESKEPKEKIIQDLLLESIIFSASTYSHLTTVWDFLKQNEGELFNRFLDQFLIKATLPNQNVLKLAKEIGGYTIAQASTYNRTPNHSYWVDVLKFIHLIKFEIIELDRKKIATITKMWLEYTPIDFPYRKECSEVALENANLMFNFKFNKGYVSGDVDEIVYKALLMGVNELPKEIIDLSLKLCKRIKVDREEKKQSEDTTSNRQIKSIFSQAKIRDKIQWQDGPYENVDDAFEKVCIDEAAINPIIDTIPEIAKEILLALFIDAPKEISFGYDSHYNLDINEPHGWFPPFYTRGPFLYFLNHQTKVGIEFIISLVNFATKQWTNAFNYKEIEVPKVIINFSEKAIDFIGNERVYFWFRDSTNVPHSIVSALMALEKFLIDTIDAEKSISEFVDLILTKGNSVAYLGILNSIGKYKSSLYLNELKPLLQVYDCYEWEKSLDYGGHNIEGHQMMGSALLGENTWKLAKEWNEMPHRKTSIQSISLPLFLIYKELKDYYNPIIELWKNRLIELESDGYTNVYLNNLINFYNTDNYVLVKHEANFYYQYKEPKELTAKYLQARNEIYEGNDSFIFPFQCFQEIKNEKKYLFEDCENLWAKIQIYSNLNHEDPYSFISGQHQSVLGGCAVLIFNKEIWIDKQPEILKWIIEYIDKVLLNYSLNKFEITQSGMDHSWTAFTARILATLWVNDLTNKRLRKQIGLLLFKSPYDTIQLLFTSISEHLKWSNKDFIQIQNLVILWSLALDKDNRSSHSNSLGGKIRKEIKKFDMNSYCQKILNDFINNKTDSTLLNWSKLRPLVPKKKRRYWDHNSDSTIGNESGLDLEMIQHAFSSIPKITQIDGIERIYVLDFWNQIINQIVFELGEINNESQHQDEYPNSFHLWAIEGISNLVSEIKFEDNILPENFWKPIFEYGHLATEWIDRFCFYFFINNIEKKDTYNDFFNEWDKMIVFANDSKTWNFKRQQYRGKEIWESLMGLTSSILNCWKNEDYTDFFEKVVIENIKWANKNAFDQDVVFKIIRVLKMKPGIIVIKEGIEIINRHLNLRKKADSKGTPDGFVRIEFKHEDALAQTVSFLWENHKELVKNDITILNNFKEIVMFLVANQNSIGIELQNRLLI